MMIFNSFTVAIDYSFGAQWPFTDWVANQSARKTLSTVLVYT